MDLSGLMISGTGSYEVKEIAPVDSSDLITNGNFADWTNDDPDWWSRYTEDANNYITENSGKCRFVSNGGLCGIYKGILTGGGYYEITIDVTDVTSGSIDVEVGNPSDVKIISSAGSYKYIIKSNGTYLVIRTNGTSDVTIDNVSLIEVPQGYPLMDVGKTYLECTSSGTVAFPSTQAYGEWEFDFYTGSPGTEYYITFINPDLVYNSTGGYRVRVYATNAITFERTGIALLLRTDVGYVDGDTWYRFKITRTLDGEFAMYIKGGAFGTDDWTLIDTTGGSGSNPITDNVITDSEYFVSSIYAGDRIANIVMRPAVKQG